MILKFSSLHKIFIGFVLFTALIHPLWSDESNSLQLKKIPGLYKGRFRPLDAISRLWLEENYNRQSIKENHYHAFHVIGPSAFALLWKIQFTGHAYWSDIPLFWIYSSRIKELLDLPLKENYFTYRQLSDAIYANKKTNLALIKELTAYHFLKAYNEGTNRQFSRKLELNALSSDFWVALDNNHLIVETAPANPPLQYLTHGFVILEDFNTYAANRQNKHLNEEIMKLIQKLQQFSRMQGPVADGENNYERLYEDLNNRGLSSANIASFLEQEYPLSERLANSGGIFKVLPAKNGEWIALNALTLKVYDVISNRLIPIANFTSFSDEQFQQIRNIYLQLINDYEHKRLKLQLAHLLSDNYQTLVNTPVRKAWEKSITYPSIYRLNIEYWYYQLPLIEICIMLYGLSIIFLIIGCNFRAKFTPIGTFLSLVAFALNTMILILRCFILGRPPVSNMFETVIYVPWVAMLASFLLSIRIKNFLLLIGASLVSLVLLILLKVTGLNSNLENVQAVLDSQFWLIIHVLMIVGSYGVFVLAGALGQIYLIQYFIYKRETDEMRALSKAILQTLYIGVALLIPGTILGGIWAAQSWGRFWDWDPKESWAFISSCVYLIFIHAYRFKKIYTFGLAIGSVIGLLAISFTWYGVNYILGTGLHSYGFGSGGEIYYYLFIIAELIFIIFAEIFHLKLTKVSDSLKKQKKEEVITKL